MHTPASRDIVLRDLSGRLVARYAEILHCATSFSPAERTALVDFIDAHLDGDCSIRAMAKLMGYSPSHFAHLFKATFELSVHRFVRRHRLERARMLLSTTSLTVAQTAAEASFSSGAHLAAALSRHVGRTPSCLDRLR